MVRPRKAGSELEDDDGRTIAAVGEFGLISRISTLVGRGASILGIGDDTAVIDLPGDDYLLATVDMLVEGVHFTLDTSQPSDIGRRLFEVSASDIASMGGSPTFALTSLALPPATPVAFVDALYSGFQSAMAPHKASLIGGNLTRTSGPIILDLTLLGTVPKVDLVTRRGARSGDLLAVTGSLGDAVAARLATERGHFADDEEISDWQRQHATPIARVAQGRVLAASHLVHAMIDLSDGLAGDLHHLCEASGVGAVIEEDKLPISWQTRKTARALSQTPSALALGGGEDYELLVALAPEHYHSALKLLDIPLTVIGEVFNRETGVLLKHHPGGQFSPLTASGWVHF